MTIYRPLIAAIVAALLFGAFLADRTRVVTETLETAKRLIPFDVTGATYLRIENLSGVYELEKRPNGEWWLTLPREMRANEDAIEVVINNLLGQRRGVPFVPENLSDYALDRPLPTITVRGANPGEEEQEITIELGSDAHREGLIYASIAGEDEIFTVYELVRNKAGVDLDNLRDNRMLRTDAEDVVAIDITPRNGETFRVERRENNSWYISDLELPASATYVARALDQGLRLKAANLQDNPTSSMAELGFDNPVLDISYETSNGERAVLLVGDRTRGGEWFHATSSYQPSVGEVRAGFLIDYFRPPYDWGTRRFIWMPREKYANIITKTGSSIMSLVRDEEGEWVFEDTPMIDIHEERLERFLEGLESFSAMSVVDADASEERKRSAYGIRSEGYAVTIVAEDGTRQGFRFGATDVSNGIIYVERLQDGAVMEIDVERPHFVRAMKGDLRDQRISHGWGEQVRRIDFTAVANDPLITISIEKRNDVWIMRSEGQPSAVLPNQLVQELIYAVEEVEYDSIAAMVDEKNPTYRLTFFNQGGEEIYWVEDVVQGETLETPVGVFDVPLEDLARMKARWDEMSKAAEILPESRN